jgi:hypothetical protein
VPAAIRIQLGEIGDTGQPFMENTQTLMLSKYGASIFSQQRFNPGQELFIRRVDTGNELAARVVGKIGQQSDAAVYAVEFADSAANFWKIEFHSSTEAETAREMFLLCRCCLNGESVPFGEKQWSAFEAVHGVLFYCMHCEAMTRWTHMPPYAAPAGGQPVNLHSRTNVWSGIPNFCRD